MIPVDGLQKSLTKSKKGKNTCSSRISRDGKGRGTALFAIATMASSWSNVDRPFFALVWYFVIFVTPHLGCHGLTSRNTLPTPSYSQDDCRTGFYVHIPYCRRRCRYCNFAIVPIGLGATNQQASFASIHQQYQTDILQELDLIHPSTNSRYDEPNRGWLSSIYFGGGTPSLAPIEMIHEILHRIRNKFTLDDHVEITMEMDPGTFTLDYLQALKESGINRISLGVQSFDDSILEIMGRVHRQSDVMDAIQMIRQVYGDAANVSMDLISGVPGLTPAKWIETLQMASNLQPAHLSIYDLQVEDGTVFGTWFKPTTFNKAVPTLPDEESVAFMYKFTAGYLKSKGFEHYEVSSYAYRPRGTDGSTARSRHNQIYWAPSSSWYAIGLGATSFVHGTLQARPKTLADYHDWVDQQTRNVGQGDMPSSLHPPDVSSDQDMMTDIIMKRLRTSDGLNLDWLQERFGSRARDTVMKGATLGLELNMAEIVSEGQDTILRLTDPNGFLYSNFIISSIFAELGYE